MQHTNKSARRKIREARAQRAIVDFAKTEDPVKRIEIFLRTRPLSREQRTNLQALEQRLVKTKKDMRSLTSKDHEVIVKKVFDQHFFEGEKPTIEHKITPFGIFLFLKKADFVAVDTDVLQHRNPAEGNELAGVINYVPHNGKVIPVILLPEQLLSNEPALKRVLRHEEEHAISEALRKRNRKQTPLTAFDETARDEIASILFEHGRVNAKSIAQARDHVRTTANIHQKQNRMTISKEHLARFEEILDLIQKTRIHPEVLAELIRGNNSEQVVSILRQLARKKKK